jgi:hypothetical protein
MSLSRILNGTTIKGYKLNKISKSFKKKYPKRYILSLLIGENHQTLNVDQIPSQLLFYNPVGYIFSYGNLIPSFISRTIQTPNIGNTFPVSLDQYLNNESDIAFQIQATNEEVSPMFTSDLIIRGNLKISNNLEEFFKENLIKHPSLESFVEDIIENIPLNCFMFPLNYPKVITMKNLNKPTSLNKMIIGYDFRVKTYDEEFSFINSIERKFENPKQRITLYQTYNNLLDKIKNKLKESEYKIINEDSIELNLETFWKLDIEYQITDLI